MSETNEYEDGRMKPSGGGEWVGDFEVEVRRDLHSSAIGPDRLLLMKGDRIRITRAYCWMGPTQYTGGYSGGGCVPRSWLVECGALPPATSSEREMVARLKERGEL